MNIIRYFLAIVQLLLISLITPAFGQGFIIESLSPSLSDITASTDSRQSTDGGYCGLIKVQTNIKGLLFDGQIVGDVSNDLNEYRVYVEKGTKELTIVRPEYVPQTIQLSDYGIDAIGAKQTYVMKLKEKSLDSDKNLLTIHTTPRDADVLIDGVLLLKDAGGGYKIRLPKDEHICSFKAEGYQSETKIVSIGKESQNLDIELKSLLQDVSIVSQTPDAEIFMNNERKAVGAWRGKLIPGMYEIEARKNGCVSWKNSFRVGDSGRQTIAIPKLAPITSRINIATTPKGMPVFVDGVWVGNSPCAVPDLNYGTHFISSSIDTLGLQKEKEISVTVRDNSAQDISIELLSERKYPIHKEANECVKNADITHVNASGWQGEKVFDLYDWVCSHLDELETNFFNKKIADGHMGFQHVFTYAEQMCLFYKKVIDYIDGNSDYGDELFVNKINGHPLEYYKKCLYSILFIAVH